MPILLLVAIVAAIVLAVLLQQTRRKSAEALRAHQEAQEQLNAKVSDLSGEVAALAQYRQINDAKAEAKRILDEGRQEANTILQDAQRRREGIDRQISDLLTRARGEADGLRAGATEEAARLRQKATQIMEQAQQRAESTLRSAQQEAATVVENAHAEARRVAGAAFDAMENATRYERVAQAMKNLIDGYGDQYIIPTHSVLDELAAEYGFVEGGEALKSARERTRQMIKHNTAATCDYVETNRRETAIRFVVDAFNGRVDTILSRTKHDNIGTLRKEIQDAYELVNHNGAAFRAARILPAYLEARLTELRWATVVHELRLRDQEEQRRIRDQIREEEKAQREFERSMRQAAKEEDTLRKAMDKIQDQVAKASDEQRAKYEAQLAEMQVKLTEAEERNRRALSMAQQTKSGHVYVISNIGSFGDDVFKIGMTRRLEPLDRVRELGDASVPFSFDVHAMIYSDDSPALEHSLHKRFLMTQMNKVNPRKEFFRLPLAALKRAMVQMGVNANWTLAADAREYRETLAIEKAMQDDPAKAAEWLKWQAELEPDTDFEDEEAA